MFATSVCQQAPSEEKKRNLFMVDWFCLLPGGSLIRAKLVILSAEVEVGHRSQRGTHD